METQKEVADLMMLMLVNTKAKATTVVKQTTYVGIYSNLFHRKATGCSPLLLSRFSSVASKNCFAFQSFWCCTRTQTHVRRPPDQNITINWGSRRFIITSNALKWAIRKFDQRMEAFSLFSFGFLPHRLTYTTASYGNMWWKLKRVWPPDINQIPLKSL